MDLEGVAGRFAGTILAFLIREDNFPLYDVMIHDYKEDLKNYPGETPRDVINDCILKLCRALVHSTDKENIKEGIQKLDGDLWGVLAELSLLQKREMLYLLAVGYYRDGDYASSLSYLDQCLEDCERDITEAGDDAPNEVKNENIIELSWALVHTRQPEDVQRGIALLEGGLTQLQIRDMLYIRSLGHYISRDFIKSLNGVCQCLQDAPDFWQGWYLRRTLLNRTETDGLLGALIFYAASAVVPAIVKARSLLLIYVARKILRYACATVILTSLRRTASNTFVHHQKSSKCNRR
ncbi:hypothetical protein C5167_047077 [Papaver somniferum]|uniref:Uncharacterized protein n=1 Tax=Papaver somniferum TaxID=3469 RepID=A0A4Y7LJK5_PAPSO|nr:hypothetical protein C5167_047077 [Papaver somniferum]